MKKVLLPIIGLFIVAAMYMLTGAKSFSHQMSGEESEQQSGADGYEEEGAVSYELNMLKDPATGKIPADVRSRDLAFAANLPTDIGIEYSGSSSRTTSPAAWQARGPWNVGGRTRAFAIDVTNANNLIAGTTSGSMWRSTDQGLTWTPTTPPNLYKTVTGVAQDTRAGHRNVWYYCSGEGYGQSAGATSAYYLGNGIYKSTDSGASWTALPSTVSLGIVSFDIWSDIVWNIVTNPANMANDEVIAAAYGGIYRSIDGGATWNLVKGSTGSPSYFTDAAVTSTGVLYVSLSSDGAQHGIFRSTDGVTFTDITPVGFPATYNRVKIGISKADESQVYFVANTPGSGTPDTNYVGTVEWNSLWKYKYLSGDGSGAGGVWNDYSANIPNTGGAFDKFTSQGSYNLVIEVKPNDSNTVFMGGSGLYRSTSGFADNTHTSIIGGYQVGAALPVVNLYLNHHPDQHQVVFLPGNPDKMFSANDGGIFFTNDNTAATIAWTSLNNGYLTSMFYTCAIDHATTSDVIIGGAQDNGSWYTNSATLTNPWVSPRGGDGSYCAVADSGKAFYFSLQQGKMWRTKLSASGVVDSSARIDPLGGHGYLFINPFVLDPNNNDIMYLAAGRCVWRNNDLAGIPMVNNWDSITTNWVKFNDSLPGATWVVTALAVSKVPANRLYYGTSFRRIYRKDNANVGSPVSVDITPAMFPASGNIGCIAVDPTNADNVMVVFTNYGVYSLFYTSNGGTTWRKVAGNLEAAVSGLGNGPSVRWASIIPVAGGIAYLVGTSVGLFAANHLDTTSADATVWTQQGTATIGSSVVDMIDYRSTDGLVVIATHSSGMYSARISDIIGSLESQNIAVSHFDLNFSNFPNPFTRTTTILFNLKERNNMMLKVYDEQGRLVSILANGQMEAGEHKFTFEPSMLSSGVYYCTLSSGTYSETRKLILLR